MNFAIHIILAVNEWTLNLKQILMKFCRNRGKMWKQVLKSGYHITGMGEFVGGSPRLSEFFTKENRD